MINFAVPVNHRVKLKESEKRNKYQDLAREQKSVWNTKVTVITGTQRLGKETGRFKNQKTYTDHRVYSIIKTRLRRILDTWGELLLLKLHWITMN